MLRSGKLTLILAFLSVAGGSAPAQLNLLPQGNFENPGINTGWSEGFNNKYRARYSTKSVPHFATAQAEIAKRQDLKEIIAEAKRDISDDSEIVEALDRLLSDAARVEKVEEALIAIEFPNVQSVQIIFNIFRQRPAELFFCRGAKTQGGGSRPRATGLRFVVRENVAR